MILGKVTKRDIGTLATIRKGGNRAHVFGGKVYIRGINAVRPSLFNAMVNKGLMVEMKDKDNHYEISDFGFEELKKYYN